MVFRGGESSGPCWGFPWPRAHSFLLKSRPFPFERVEFPHQIFHFPLFFLQPPATVQGSGVDGVCFCVEDITPSPQDALPIGGDYRIEGGAVVVDKVVRIKQQVEVFHSLGQEERLHAVVKLVVPQIFDLAEAGSPLASPLYIPEECCRILGAPQTASRWCSS